MTLKEFWAGTGRWLRAHKPSIGAANQPEIDEDGLISRNDDSAEQTSEKNVPAGNQGNNFVVRAVPPADRQESLQKLQEGFDKLVEQLQGINEHLNRQASQHEDLMARIEQLPEMLESFPAVVENQKRITEQLLEQLKATAAKNEQFIDAVEKIPNETAKQTDALVDINHQLSAAADIDVQMTESLNNFNESLDKLNQSTVSQTDGIIQMSKTFAASDRYLKYIISKQNKRFMWIFIAAISICTTVILILIGIIIYLKY
jgi:DNA repair exonuclease SbcCD ATPase subunit